MPHTTPDEAPPPADGAAVGAVTPAPTAPLVDEVWGLIGDPVDAYAVVATLESIGWRDLDAQTEFGRADLFALGAEVYALCKARAQRPAAAPRRDPRQRGAATVRQFVRHYAKGLLFATPMLGQIALILILSHSLWAWLYFSEAQATGVAVATLLSLVVAGGFTQSIGREGIYHRSHENGRLAQQACRRLVLLGSATVVAVALLGAGVAWMGVAVPAQAVAVGVTYFLLLAHLWLFLSILYVFEDFLGILAITVLGVAPVDAVMRFTTWGIHVAHALGLLFACALAAAAAHRHLARAARETKPELAGAELPPRSTTMYEVAPYFAYGVLYFTFLSVDRLNAWSAPTGGPGPYPLRFQTAYELGMAWALVSLFLTLAALQYTVHLFSDVLIPRQKAFGASELQRHNRYFRRFYLRHLALLVATGAVSVGATYALIETAAQLDAAGPLADLLASRVTPFVFAVAAAGYLLLAVALFNVLFFFTLARPRLVLRSITPGVVANAAVGYAASRWLGYEFAVVGLLAGALVFAVVSTALAAGVFRRFDFYYYSAY